MPGRSTDTASGTRGIEQIVFWGLICCFNSCLIIIIIRAVERLVLFLGMLMHHAIKYFNHTLINTVYLCCGLLSANDYTSHLRPL